MRAEQRKRGTGVSVKLDGEATSSFELVGLAEEARHETSLGDSILRRVYGFEAQKSYPLVAGEVPLFWTSDELAQNLLYCGGTKGFAFITRVAWVKNGF